MQTTMMSVIAATARRVVQVMPRLTHHKSAQLMMTGTMISSDGKLLSEAIERELILGVRKASQRRAKQQALPAADERGAVHDASRVRV